MRGHYYARAEYALQRDVDSFGNLLFKLANHHSIKIYALVFPFCQLANIDYLVLRYLNTSALTSNEFSEEWLFDDEV